MSELGQYVYEVILAAIFTSVILAVTPGNATISAVIRLVAGILLLLVLVTPLVRSRGDYFIDVVADVETEAASIIATAEEKRDCEIATVIKQRAESYISDMARELGADVQVEIDIQMQSPYLPCGIIISGAVSPIIKQQLISAIEKDIGLPEESQIWMLA